VGSLLIAEKLAWAKEGHVMESTTYESYPAWMVAISAAVALAIYVAGAAILRGFGLWLAALSVVYAVWVELKVLRGSCIHCAYYGRVCGLGRGKLCALFFARGDPEWFSRRPISWKAMLPDLMVTVFPLVGGVILLVRDFSWVILGLMLVLILLSTVGNGMVRGSLACKHCRQRELGCPAEQLFSRERA
jgi:hypothetical protein